MNYYFSILVVLGIGMFSLMVGILINREPEQSPQSALAESLVWGTGFLLSFGAEFLLIGSV
jgi:hypothetical protein